MEPEDRVRRALLQGLAALAGAAAWPLARAQAPTLSRAQATALQQSLLGLSYRDNAVADALLRALSASVGEQPLAQLARLASTSPRAKLAGAVTAAGLDGAATAVLVALASGVVDTAGGPVVITYENALAWQMVPWTKPNASCGGLTDYWSTAPARKS